MGAVDYSDMIKYKCDSCLKVRRCTHLFLSDCPAYESMTMHIQKIARMSRSWGNRP